jgi:hypothetical protein
LAKDESSTILLGWVFVGSPVAGKNGLSLAMLVEVSSILGRSVSHIKGEFGCSEQEMAVCSSVAREAQAPQGEWFGQCVEEGGQPQCVSHQFLMPTSRCHQQKPVTLLRPAGCQRNYLCSNLIAKQEECIRQQGEGR